IRLRICLQHSIDSLQVNRSILADCGMRAAPGLNAKNALFWKGSGNDEQALIFLGINVVSNHNDVVTAAHRLTKHLYQRGLPGANRSADSYAQGRIELRTFIHMNPEGPGEGISPQRHRGREGASTKAWKKGKASKGEFTTETQNEEANKKV